MKKLLIAFLELFSEKSQVYSDRYFHLSFSKSLAADLDRLKISAGCRDWKHLFVSMVALTQWAFRVLEAGYIIIAIDPASLNYRQLSVKGMFPNLEKTSDQELDDVEEGEDLVLANHDHEDSPPGDSFADEESLRRALAHFKWSLYQEKKGARIGAYAGGIFTPAPEFES